MTDGSHAIPELCHLPCCHEPLSSLSHLFGMVFFLFLGALLLRRGRGDRARVIFLGVYAVSCVLLFCMSGLYHAVVRGGAAHLVFERLDHSAIFVLVAGTSTPIHGLLFRGWLRWGPLLVIWSAAVVGIVLKTIFFDSIADWLGMSFYLALGWLGLFSAILLARRYGFTFVQPLLLGGVIYSLGAVMDLFGWLVIIPGVVHPHELFHLAILAAALLHWRFIWRFARRDPWVAPAC